MQNKDLKDVKKLNKNERASLIKKRKSKPIIQAEVPVINKNIVQNQVNYVKVLQIIHDKNVQDIKDNQDGLDYVKVALIEAEQIWLNVQILMKSEQYKNMTDDEKISLIQRDFAEFYKNFPIVSRYMICLGEYRSVAFKKMLIKCNETKAPSGKGKEIQTKESQKDLNEKLWVERQADYVRFLWEELQGINFNQDDSNSVWQQTHDSLSAEFLQFKTMHADAEAKIKTDSLAHKKELLYELSERIVSGQQNLNDDTAKALLSKLLDKLYMQRSKKMIKELSLITKPTEVSSEGTGINVDAKLEYDDEIQQSFYKKTYKKMDINKLMT